MPKYLLCSRWPVWTPGRPEPLPRATFPLLRRSPEFGGDIGEYVGCSGCRDAYSNTYCWSGPNPERCVEAYYLRRTRLESIAERKVRRQQWTEEGNIETTGAICVRTPPYSR